ncbi:MAG TPA: hypothetical protein VFN81_06665 [Sphingomicrobium sp.]|nr:hypothetical protein [Sphingomicrobium sp.]
MSSPAYVVHPEDRLFAITRFLELIAHEIGQNTSFSLESRRQYAAMISGMASEARAAMADIRQAKSQPRKPIEIEVI